MAKMLIANPRKRKRAVRKTSSKRTTVRRYKRNPSARTKGVIETVKNSAIGAGGALAVDFAWNQLMNQMPAESEFQTSALAPVAKGAVSIALGMLVGNLGKNKALGNQIAQGGLTVALYEAGKGLMPDTQTGYFAGNDGLLGYDDGLLGYTGVAQQFDPVYG